MSDASNNDNVIDLNAREHPDWLTEANKLGGDYDEESAVPAAALDESIVVRPSGGVLDRAALGLEPETERAEQMLQLATAVESAVSARPKARSLSKAEREAAAIEAERIETEANLRLIASRKDAEAETKRYDPMDPQRLGAFITALVVGIVIFITSALFSFAAVAKAAEWMQPEWPWLSWVVPGFIEAFIIFFGIDTIIWQARATNPRFKPEQVEAATSQSNSALIWMFVFAGVAVVANGAHTVQAWLATGEVPWYGFVGILMAALAPASVVLITKRVSRLVFIYAVR